MATSLITVDETKEMENVKAMGDQQQQQQQQQSPTSATNPPLVRIGSKEAAIVTRSIKINDSIGEVKVHIQGELDDKKAVFLTVHDIGTNSSAIKEFVDIDCMVEIRLRSVFIHVDVPGQEDNANDLENFPTIQQLGEEILLKILDELGVQLCVGIGDGAGANILARFGLAHPERILGLVLVNLVSAGVGFLESIKEKLFARRRSSQQLCSEEIVAMHKFGNSHDDAMKQLIETYSNNISKINGKNLRKYMTAYMNRKEISDLSNLDVLLVVGGRSPFVHGVEHVYSKCNKQKTSILKIDNIVDVISQCPEKLAQSLLLFVKGLGFLTSLQLPGIQNDMGMATMKANLAAIGRRRTLSMEEYDIPRMRRLSLTK
ncbi:hypothetical protein RDWZM_009915 [Blomia tropicalis]|uniref:Uncharacterized protein n=1 Tax=Blomia tropicalis TaxID=40697 RepID=A0A9Q0LXH4_BLOTA|nr:hypothetical protein BLOT_009910 [Blomia tropicalis]KAJ6215415.1 hypothetical protein RDWZM_009915 [Blomia tropicalis]